MEKIKNLCCIRSCAEHDLKIYFGFHEWAYLIALFCMSSFKRFVKQGGEIQPGANLEKTEICSVLMLLGINCEHSGLYLKLPCGFHLCCLALISVAPLFFYSPLFICCCLYNFKVKKWLVFSSALICNDSFKQCNNQVALLKNKQHNFLQLSGNAVPLLSVFLAAEAQLNGIRAEGCEQQ